MFSIVQTRSIDPIESDVNNVESNARQFSSDQITQFLTYLKHQSRDNDNDLSSSDKEDVKPISKRGFFLFPTRRSSQKYRPTYSYGRKSHWDTFFG